MLPSEIFANVGTSEEELAITEDIQLAVKDTLSLEPIIWFLMEDADNTPVSIWKAYRDHDWEEDLLWYQGKLVVPDSESLKEQLLKEFHNSPLAGHPGQQQTLELLTLSSKSIAGQERSKVYLHC
ncbi:hypothetical protein RhiTH_009783 [Rhizoctonia solani]